MPPSFIILGAQKAATSLVQRCLREHPEVFMPGDETPFFEDPHYRPGDTAALDAQVRAPAGARVVGIKRADYLARPEVPPRIAEMLPSVRLLAVLRNPTDRALSAYHWYVLCRFLPLLPAEEGMRRILDDPQFLKDHPHAADILEYGLYGKHLETYLRFFDRNRLLILVHEDFRREPANILRRCYEFVGVDPTYAPRSLHSRPKQSIYNPVRLRFLRTRLFHRFVLGYYAFHPFSRRPADWAESLGYLVKAAVLFTDRVVLAAFFGNSAPRISPTLRARIDAYYQNDISALEKLLDRDLSAWRPDAVRSPA